MVKPDIKHSTLISARRREGVTICLQVSPDYYADLELPTEAPVEDVRKAYRKLALQYHPDRNAGKESECVPRFQAIQAANEVLCDPASKQKYDNDRRKVGLFPTGPTFNPRQAAPGNPYAASSAYPPPPRRTAPGTWQRPPQAGASAANGADRFSNFPRPSPTAKRDPAQDRTNVFRAWQNMNSTQDRQQRFNPAGAQPPPPPPMPPPPQSQTKPQPTRQRPPVPPRNDPKMPTEEQIRAGMKYKNVPQVNTEEADKRQSAWSAFSQANAGKPGMARSNTQRTPRRQGFNPNAPGSNERQAPETASHYVHRNKSEDFGRPEASRRVPPPPPGPPPAGATPTTPLSPTSPTTRRPFADPTRPFSGGTPDDQVPFAEGTRKRTPYTSFIGEKTAFSAEGLRRSNSTRDTSKLGPGEAADRSRARSTSPLGRQHASDGQAEEAGQRKPFVVYSSSESSDSSSDSDNIDSSANHDPQRPGTAPNTAPLFERPKKIPTPPSSRFPGPRNGPTSPPPVPRMPRMNGYATDGAQSDNEQPGMQQKFKSNMYAKTSPFSSRKWMQRMFGSYSTSRARRAGSTVPNWAIPSSLNPSLRCDKQKPVVDSKMPANQSYVTAADDLFTSATEGEQQAYFRFQSELAKEYLFVPANTDMEVFLKLATIARNGTSSGDQVLDRLLGHVLLEFPTVGYPLSYNNTDERPRANSFEFKLDDDAFTPTNAAKSRSEENINTQFSPDGWHGQFTGAPSGYFAPPPPTGKKPPSPSRRTTSSRSGREQARSATFDVHTPTSAPQDAVPQRRWGSDGLPREMQPQAEAGGTPFSQDEWKQTFSDGSWTSLAPQAARQTSPIRSGASGGARKQSQGRRPSRASNRGTTTAKPQQPNVVHEDDDETVDVGNATGIAENGTTFVDDGDAMDIDNTPPAGHQTPQATEASTLASEQGARLYSVEPSPWRQQQEEKQVNGSHRKTSSASRRAQRASADASDGTKLNTSLDDLRNVAPIAKSADGGGLQSLSDIGSTLPFQSQAATTLPSHISVPQSFDIPKIPAPPLEPQRLTKASWHTYAEDFGAYLKHWHIYNDTMLQHFLSRERIAEWRFMNGTAWLEATGDTIGGTGPSGMLQGPSGFGSYLANVREDERTREGWNLGCEKYTEAVKGFEKVRERVRQLVVGGTLRDK